MPDQEVWKGSEGSTRREKRLVRFGPFEFRPGTQELLKQGVRIKVQAKPLQILNALVERPGELVTRDELCRELWPDGTFVDFESGLNTATNRLRAALNDSAEQRVYIETLPRLGYRFICPVSYSNESRTVPSGEEPSRLEAAPPGVSAQEQAQSLPQPVAKKPKYRTTIWIAASMTAMILFAVGVMSNRRGQTVFHPVTYQEQVIRSARFVQGSDSAAFTTYTSSQGARTYQTRADAGDVPPSFVSDGQLASAAPSGDILIEVKGENSKLPGMVELRPNGERQDLGASSFGPVELSPGGNSIVRSRRVDSGYVLEFPPGHVAYRSPGWFTDLRISPDTRRVAFIEHPVRGDDNGHVRVLDRNGVTKVLTPDWNSAQGLAWTPSGNEIWFTASKASAAQSLFAVSMSGEVRRVTGSPTSLHLFDISANSRVLLSLDSVRNSMLAEFPGWNHEKDVTEFDMPSVEAMSRDGQNVLFTERGDAGGEQYSALLFDNRAHRSHPIAHGRGMALSPDERTALAMDPKDNTALTLVKLQGGGSARISGNGLHYQWARFVTNNILLVGGSFNSGPLTLFRQSVAGEAPVPMKEFPYLDYPVVSFDGSKVAGLAGEDLVVIDFCRKSATHLPLQTMMVPVAWSGDGRKLFLYALSGATTAIFKYDLASDSVTKWKQLGTSAAASAGDIGAVVAAPDAGAYAYSLHLDLSRLYVVDGLS